MILRTMGSFEVQSSRFKVCVHECMHACMYACVCAYMRACGLENHWTSGDIWHVHLGWMWDGYYMIKSLNCCVLVYLSPFLLVHNHWD